MSNCLGTYMATGTSSSFAAPGINRTSAHSGTWYPHKFVSSAATQSWSTGWRQWGYAFVPAVQGRALETIWSVPSWIPRWAGRWLGRLAGNGPHLHRLLQYQEHHASDDQVLTSYWESTILVDPSCLLCTIERGKRNRESGWCSTAVLR